MANSVLPQPALPATKVGRPLGKPPPVISSRPEIPVSDLGRSFMGCLVRFIGGIQIPSSLVKVSKCSKNSKLFDMLMVCHEGFDEECCDRTKLIFIIQIYSGLYKLGFKESLKCCIPKPWSSINFSRPHRLHSNVHCDATRGRPTVWFCYL